MIYLYGAGGHAKVIADILERCDKPIGGFFDQDTNKKIWNYSVFSFPGPFNFLEDELIISIGDNNVRKKIATTHDVKYANAIHPATIISVHSFLGCGCAIMGGVLINADTIIGNHCIINTSASIDHDCVIGDFVHISPNATLCGGVTLGNGVHIGAGATILPGKKIGANTII
ncbi:MAG: NeuD/PglB/VioB family sugar acetyltransferase, partial [Chitinophagaceae bacterium]